MKKIDPHLIFALKVTIDYKINVFFALKMSILAKRTTEFDDT
jgi:hypothetical protein